MFRGFVLTCMSWLSIAGLALAAEEQPNSTDARSAGPDFQTQGEYVGEIEIEGVKKKVGVQVIALGDGKFSAVVYHGGLPGDSWKKGDPKESFDCKTENGVTAFMSQHHQARIADGKIAVSDLSGKEVGTLKKAERQSPTLAAKPPADAVVLFDGSNADEFVLGKVTPDGLLQVGTKTKQEFVSCQLHVEFRTPFMPTARGQGRGNSGVYVHDCYEFQVLDSFGLEGENNECGGLYSMEEPKLNMCFPPLAWQTYDFDFTAPKFDSAGKKTANARVTLRHNGVVIYDDLEIPRLTPGGRSNEAATGPLALQNHGNSVVYRNIWLVEKKP